METLFQTESWPETIIAQQVANTKQISLKFINLMLMRMPVNLQFIQYSF